ncbi:MAG: flagellar basal body rod protein FlgB [Alphaproteobacteria bacterium]|nr:flagellar basal body rod protein FlgB [Alphaproteobacteria bacterium]
MQLGDIPLLSMLKERMVWLNQRQDILSQNIASADVPTYTARDLKPMDFEDVLRKATAASRTPAGSLAVTDPRHIGIKGAGDSGFDTFSAPDQAANSTGNTVSLEEEMIKVSDTQAQFQAATNLYAKALGMMRTAIGR